MEVKLEIEISEVLLSMCAGTEEEAKSAFAWLYRNTWEEVLCVLKSKYTLIGLSDDHKYTAVNMAYQTLWELARNDKIKDSDKDPRALLHSIAYRKSVDKLRKDTAKKRKASPEEWEQYVNEAIEESSISTQWKHLEIKGLAAELMDEFKAWMLQQKNICRRTALAIALFFPDLVGPKELHEHLSGQVDPPPTYQSVKKARTDVLRRFKNAIENKYEGMWKS